MRSTYGSVLHAEHVPERDTLVVERLRAAGAVIYGKSNTPEGGTGSHTYNRVFGTTTNPYDPTRSAGGSSGGAIAAPRPGSPRSRTARMSAARCATRPRSVTSPMRRFPGAELAVRTVGTYADERTDGAYRR